MSGDGRRLSLSERASHSPRAHFLPVADLEEVGGRFALVGGVTDRLLAEDKPVLLTASFGLGVTGRSVELSHIPAVSGPLALVARFAGGGRGLALAVEGVAGAASGAGSGDSVAHPNKLARPPPCTAVLCSSCVF